MLHVNHITSCYADQIRKSSAALALGTITVLFYLAQKQQTRMQEVLSRMGQQQTVPSREARRSPQQKPQHGVPERGEAGSRELEEETQLSVKVNTFNSTRGR